MSNSLSPPAAPSAPWAIGLRGARANLGPGIVLQAIALTLALAYYFNPATHHVLDQLSEYRTRAGFFYSSSATAFFGGLLPCLYLWLQPATSGRYDWRSSVVLTLFWAYKGIEVDLLYRFLGHAVGTEVKVGTVATKVILDQFGYSFFWSVPSVTLFYEWVDTKFDLRAVGRDWQKRNWYWRRALPNMISNWGVWIPSVCVIYSLPPSLQVPFFNLVLCFYTLLLAHIAAHQRRENPLAPVHHPTIAVG